MKTKETTEQEVQRRRLMGFYHSRSKERAGGSMFRVTNGPRFNGTHWARDEGHMRALLKKDRVAFTDIIRLRG